MHNKILSEQVLQPLLFGEKTAYLKAKMENVMYWNCTKLKTSLLLINFLSSFNWIYFVLLNKNVVLMELFMIRYLCQNAPSVFPLLGLVLRPFIKTWKTLLVKSLDICESWGEAVCIVLGHSWWDEAIFFFLITFYFFILLVWQNSI